MSEKKQSLAGVLLGFVLYCMIGGTFSAFLGTQYYTFYTMIEVEQVRQELRENPRPSPALLGRAAHLNDAMRLRKSENQSWPGSWFTSDLWDGVRPLEIPNARAAVPSKD